MKYTPGQEKLNQALKAHYQISRDTWAEVVTATNELVTAIEAGEEYYDASFPPEVERNIDAFASETAWVYMRLESAAKLKRNTSRKIRKAMGYSG